MDDDVREGAGRRIGMGVLCSGSIINNLGHTH
jgi:hypothetical protein